MLLQGDVVRSLALSASRSLRHTHSGSLPSVPSAPALAAHTNSVLQASTFRRRRVLRHAAGGSGDQSTDDDSSFEPRRKQRYAAKVKPKVQVSTPIVDSAMGTGGAAPPETAEAETRYLLGLTAVFLAIILEGLLVAGSGFMAEQYDQLVQDRVLPIFGPTVLVFLAGSSAYGVWKAYGKSQ